MPTALLPDLEEQAEGDEARVTDFDKQLDQGVVPAVSTVLDQSQ